MIGAATLSECRLPCGLQRSYPAAIHPGASTFRHVQSVPTGFTSLLTTADAAKKVGVAYTHGAGMVVYNAMPVDHYLPGGIWDQLSLCTASNVCAGMRTYLTNVIAWATGYNPGPTTTCASEGYTGTKLSWCKIICESESSSSTIDTYLRRWINRYHDLPYCAVEPQPTLR